MASLAVAALACSRPAPPAGLGRRLVEAEALALRASPDGAWLAFLTRCSPRREPTLPAGTASCSLEVAPAGGGPAQRLATGVTTLGPGFAWSRTGHVLVALADHDLTTGRGALVLWAGGDARRLASDVTFHALDREGRRVGWVSGGQLFLGGSDGGAAAPVPGAAGVATFEFGGKQGVEVLARRTSRAGGALLAVSGGHAAAVAADVREYAFAPGGDRFAYTSGVAQALALASAAAPRPAPLGRDVASFVFSPRGESIAFVADARPGRQGDLWIASTAGGSPQRLGPRVGEPRWGPDGARLGWLQEYDPRSRTGTLVVGGVGAKPRALAERVSDFDLAPDGRGVAYLVHETAGGYSVDLGLAAIADGAAPATVARGVFGFAFSPDGRWLYYRTGCVREAEACDLYRVPAAGLSPGVKAERIAEGVKSFEFAPGRPDRLLVTWSRKDRVALDLAMWEGGRLSAVDTAARPGSAQFLGGEGRRLAYLVNDPKRQGVYVADLP